MSIEQRTCFVLVCDVPNCDPWDDGEPHFLGGVAAAEYAKAAGWVLHLGKTLCARHAAKADCTATGHQWDDWCDEELYGVRFRRRWCDHCGLDEYDPPFKELSAKFQALRDAQQVIAEAVFKERNA